MSRELKVGCDIHVVLEQRFENQWVGVHACPYMIRYRDKDDHEEYVGWQLRNRNYEFFTLLAGVRGDGPEPKGLPEDASPLARMKAAEWGNDGHSHSYCSLEEFTQKEMQTWTEPQLTTTIRRKIVTGDDGLLAHAERLFGIESDVGLDQYRVVFWFDN